MSAAAAAAAAAGKEAGRGSTGLAGSYRHGREIREDKIAFQSLSFVYIDTYVPTSIAVLRLSVDPMPAYEYIHSTGEKKERVRYVTLLY